MVDDNLINHVREGIKRNTDLDKLKKRLQKVGHKKIHVEEAISHVHKKMHIVNISLLLIYQIFLDLFYCSYIYD